MRRTSFVACLAVVVLAAAARAEDKTYTIKFKHGPDAGKSVVVKTKDKADNAVTVTDPDGKVVNEDKGAQEKDEVYTDTVVEKGDKKPKKFKRAYEKATLTKGGKATTLPYDGRTVVFELKGDKYEATAEGTPAVPKPVLDGLARQAGSGDEETDEVVLPKKPVKVGDKWAVEGKALAAALAKGAERLTLDPDKSKAGATLKKAYEKDGKQFGVIEVTMKLAVKSAGGLAFEDKPADLEVKLTLDVSIDGSSTAAKLTELTKMSGKGTTTINGKKYTVELNGDSTRTSEQSAEKAK